jgi:glycosyltransferase involved in cell wall biosynthesis
MDVTIIIPTYNRLWSLPAAIESCRNTKCATEIIVVDDGSTDETWDWLQQQKDLVILQQPNRGKCWAVNKAFALAKGKYVRFLDSDDCLNEFANDEQFTIAEDSLSDIVVSGYKIINEQHNLISLQHWIECDDFIAQQLGECDGSHYSSFLFRKSLIDDLPHRPDYAYRDDRLFILEAALKKPKIAVHTGTALSHMLHSKPRLQHSAGIKQVVQNFQHVNIYKQILMQLDQHGELTSRRIKASVNVLWPLSHWIAKYDINEAEALFQWIIELSPDFKIPEKGLLGLAYNGLGFKVTERILSMQRLIKNAWK